MLWSDRCNDGRCKGRCWSPCPVSRVESAALSEVGQQTSLRKAHATGWLVAATKALCGAWTGVVGCGVGRGLQLVGGTSENVPLAGQCTTSLVISRASHIIVTVPSTASLLPPFVHPRAYNTAIDSSIPLAVSVRCRQRHTSHRSTARSSENLLLSL